MNGQLYLSIYALNIFKLIDQSWVISNNKIESIKQLRKIRLEDFNSFEATITVPGIFTEIIQIKADSKVDKEQLSAILRYYVSRFHSYNNKLLINISDGN